MHTLQGWQPTDPRISAALLKRILMSVTVAALLLGFAILLRSPYERPTLHWVVIAPGSVSHPLSESSMPIHTSRATLDASNNWQALDRDVASMLCYASGHHVTQKFNRCMPHARLAQPSALPISQQAIKLTDDLARFQRPQSTLVVYVSGVLSIDNKQSALCTDTHSATHGGGELVPLALLNWLKKVDCQQVLLCIDLVPPSHAAPAVMATPLLINQLTESLEQSLADDDQQTPLAVCVSVSSVDEVLRTAAPASPFASALVEALESERSYGNFQLHRLQNKLTELTRHLDTPVHSIWFTSPHWPVVSNTIQLPSTPKAADDLPGTLATDKAISSGEISISSLENVEVDELTPAQLWQVGRLAIESMNQVATQPDEQQLVAWLPLPERLSYRQRHPFTSAWLDRLWRNLAATRQFAVAEPDSEALRSFVKQLLNLSHGQQQSVAAIPAKSRDTNPLQDVRLRPTNSLLLNATYGRLGFVESQAGFAAQQMLHLLTQAIDNSNSTEECRTAIEKLHQLQTNRFLELDQCLTSCESGIAWRTLQDILRLQLIAHRAHLDLFLNNEEVQAVLHDADECAHLVRQEMVVRPASHSDIQLDMLVDRAIGLYQQALTRMTDVEHELHYRNSSASELLLSHAWTQLSSGSSQGAQRLLSIFVDQWKFLHSENDRSTIENQFQDVQRSLHNNQIGRAARIDAILQLNRAVLADTELRLSTLAEQRQSGLASAEGVFESGALRLFLRLTSTQSANASSARLTYSDSSSAQPQLSWVAERLHQTVNFNVAHARKEMQGATTKQLASLQRNLTMWERVAEELVAQGIPVAPHGASNEWLAVDAPMVIDIQRNDCITLPCSITYETNATAPAQLSAEYDDQALDVRWNERLLQPSTFIDLPTSEWQQEVARDRVLSTSRILLSVKRVAGRTADKPIVLLVSQGQARRRAVVHLATPSATLVDVQLVTSSCKDALDNTSTLRESSPVDHQRDIYVLAPNQPQSLQLQLSNLRSSPLRCSVQLWGTNTRLADVPEGTLSELSSRQWLSSVPELAPLAKAPEVVLDALASQCVALLPSDSALDFKQAPYCCQNIVLGVTDLKSQSTQFKCFDLHVRYPTDYVQQKIALEGDAQDVLVHTHLRDSIGSSASIHHQLLEWPSAEVIAQSQDQLTRDSPSRQIKLSYRRSRADRVVLVTHVDGWRGVWVHLFDRRSGQFSSEPIAHVSLQSNFLDGVVPSSGDETKVEVAIDAWSSGSPMDPLTELRVGWDRNRDRSLMSEASVRLSRLSSISARFQGVTPAGAMLMEGLVQPQRLTLPITGLSNERASMLVQVERNNKVIAHSDASVVVDRQPPAIVKVQVENGNRCLLGGPLMIQVEANDADLSGVAHVEAAWALDGRMQLTADMKPLPAVLRPDGRWMLTLPTTNMPLGENFLLICAVDKSGNRSDTYPLTVRLHSQIELDEIAANATSNIVGKLTFAQVPQSGLHIELLKQSSEEKSSTNAKIKESSEGTEERCVATATTQANGSFRLDAVRSGSYTMRVSGIVRGTKVQRTRPIVVSAPKGVEPIVWRLDTQP